LGSGDGAIRSSVKVHVEITWGFYARVSPKGSVMKMVLEDMYSTTVDVPVLAIEV
jgi:hypothetical protein